MVIMGMQPAGQVQVRFQARMRHHHSGTVRASDPEEGQLWIQTQRMNVEMRETEKKKEKDATQPEVEVAVTGLRQGPRKHQWMTTNAGRTWKLCFPGRD